MSSEPDSQVSAPNTPPTTCRIDTLKLDESASVTSSSIPWHGYTYIIQNVSTKKAIAHVEGKVTLVELGGPEAVRWVCVSRVGWLGFRDPVSALFLGYKAELNHKLGCFANHHKGHESFCVRQKPDGNYVLLMPYLWPGEPELRPVGVAGDDLGLEVFYDCDHETVAWKFIKV